MSIGKEDSAMSGRVREQHDMEVRGMQVVYLPCLNLMGSGTAWWPALPVRHCTHRCTEDHMM